MSEHLNERERLWLDATEYVAAGVVGWRVLKQLRGPVKWLLVVGAVLHVNATLTCLGQLLGYELARKDEERAEAEKVAAAKRQEWRDREFHEWHGRGEPFIPEGLRVVTY
jgi:hypothetical protein